MSKTINPFKILTLVFLAACSQQTQGQVLATIVVNVQNPGTVSGNTEEDEGVVLDQGDAGSVAEWMAIKLEDRDYIAVQEVVDKRGVNFFPIGVGFDFDNNLAMSEFAQKLENAAGDSSPICEGYKTSGSNDPLEKLWVVFSGLMLNERVTELKHTNDIVSFLFVKTNGEWGLVAVGPENDPNYSGILSGLTSCSKQ